MANLMALSIGSANLVRHVAALLFLMALLTIDRVANLAWFVVALTASGVRALTARRWVANLVIPRSALATSRWSAVLTSFVMALTAGGGRTLLAGSGLILAITNIAHSKRGGGECE